MGVLSMGFARSLIGILLLLVTSLAEAGIYKWVDEQGRVHYGDKPTSTTADEINVKDQPAPQQPGLAASRKEKQQRFLRAREDERKEKQQALAEEKQKRAEAKRNCEQAERDYKKYHYAGSIYEKRKDGEREYLSASQREAYEASLAAKIKKWCKK